MSIRKKIPKSVLVLIHDDCCNVLLLERADRTGFWQSVTGSLDHQDEDLFVAAKRELMEETGIETTNDNWLDWNLARKFKIFSHWKHRYEDNVEFNTEYVFSVCIEKNFKIKLSPREHISFNWLPHEIAAKKCFSWTNSLAIKELPMRHNCRQNFRVRI